MAVVIVVDRITGTVLGDLISFLVHTILSGWDRGAGGYLLGRLWKTEAVCGTITL
jgi:hypothetical protein